MSEPVLTRADARILNRKTKELAQIGPLPLVEREPRGAILFSVVTPGALRCRGKVEPEQFFPPFLKEAAALGWQCAFALSEDAVLAELERSDRPTVLINLFNEERHDPDSKNMRDAEGMASLVFNPVGIGKIIGNKKATNDYLTARGVLMPEQDIGTGDKVFSNLVDQTSRPAWVTDTIGADEEGRYNTRFIDTGYEFDGRRYLTTVRLLTVGAEIVHGFVGARIADSRRAYVHGVNTPLDADLVSRLYQDLYTARLPELKILARKLAAELGNGFYHHDLLIEQGTGQIYLCETGFKFDAFAFFSRMAPIAEDCPMLLPLKENEFASSSAKILIQQAEQRIGGFSQC